MTSRIGAGHPNGHLHIVRASIAAGADVSATDKEGWTALHVAARWGHLTVVQALIQAGAGVSATDKDGRTALHLAAREGHLPAARSEHHPPKQTADFYPT